MLGLSWFGGSSGAFTMVLGLAYLTYLLAISPSRRGRFVLGLGSAVTLIGAWLISPGAAVVGLLTVGLIWLVRAVLFDAGILPALWDGMLCMLSVVCAFGTAIATQRLWLAVWVFFLLQSLFVYIPKSQYGGCDGRGQTASGQGDSFARAHRAAEAALQTMAQRL